MENSAAAFSQAQLVSTPARAEGDSPSPLRGEREASSMTASNFGGTVQGVLPNARSADTHVAL